MLHCGEREDDDGGSSSPSEQLAFNIGDPASPALKRVISEIMDLYSAPSCTKPELERLLSRFMNDLALSGKRLLGAERWDSGNQISLTGSRNLRLQFLNEVLQPVCTGVPIKGKISPLKVALIDDRSGEIVRFGPEASSTVEIVVLEEDFGGVEGESWTSEEFKSKILTRKGNKQFLTGDIVLDLHEGIGYVGILCFPHTRVYKSIHKYRLGAIAKDVGTIIREGMTESFRVEDRRLDKNKKHDCPTQNDDVWRLKNIARDGAFHKRLHDENINTVEDFLKQLNTNPQKLRDILGKQMSAKMWEVTVDHARKCTIDEIFYFYSSSGSQQKTGVVFNAVGQVTGLYSESQYLSYELLSENQKADAENLVISAFQQWDKVASFDDEASLFDKFSGPSDTICTLKSPTMVSSSSTKILIPQKDDQLDFQQTAVSFDDNTSLFDESPNVSNKVFHPRSPINESCSSSTIMNPLNIIEQGFSLPVASFADDSSNFNEFPILSNIICPSISPVAESSNGSSILTFRKLGEPDSPQSAGFSQDIAPTYDSVWDMSYHNDHNLQCVDNTDHQHESPFSFSSQMTDSDLWDTESMIRSSWEEILYLPLQFSVDDVALDSQAVISESLDNPQSNENETLMVRSAVVSKGNVRKRFLRNKARRRWRVLFTAMRWLSVRRNAAGKLPFGKLFIKLSSSLQDLQAAGNVDSVYDRHLIYGEAFETPTSYESKGFQILSCKGPLLSRNLSMKSEANLHSAVNDILLARSFAVATNITQKRYLPKREKARRRWKKLYSLMRWFSVQRNVVNKRYSSAFTTSNPSCSTSLENLSCIWSMDSSSYDQFITRWDASLNQENPMHFACQFHENEYVQLFNKFCSLQPRSRFSINKLARRSGTERNLAKMRWRLLFSIMKWLSVRRNTAKLRGPYNNC